MNFAKSLNQPLREPGVMKSAVCSLLLRPKVTSKRSDEECHAHCPHGMTHHRHGGSAISSPSLCEASGATKERFIHGEADHFRGSNRFHPLRFGARLA